MAAVGGIGVGGAGGGGGGGGGGAADAAAAAAAAAAPATPASFRLFRDELRIRINNFKLRFKTFDRLSLRPDNRSGHGKVKNQRLNDTVSALEDPLNLRSLPEVIQVLDEVEEGIGAVIGLLAFKKEDKDTWILDVNTYQSDDYEAIGPSQYISTVSIPLRIMICIY